jgi:hypothetical protein
MHHHFELNHIYDRADIMVLPLDRFQRKKRPRCWSEDDVSARTRDESWVSLFFFPSSIKFGFVLFLLLLITGQLAATVYGF